MLLYRDREHVNQMQIKRKNGNKTEFFDLINYRADMAGSVVS